MVPKHKTKIVSLKFKEVQNIKKVNTMVNKTEEIPGSQSNSKVRKQEAAATNISQKVSGTTTTKSSTNSTPVPSKQSAVPSSSNSISGNSLITSSKGLPMNQATTGNGILSLDRSGKRVRHWTKQPRIVKSFTGYLMVFGSWLSKSRHLKKTTESLSKDGKTIKPQNGSTNGAAATKLVDAKTENGVKLESNSKKDIQSNGSASEESKVLVSAN